MECDCEERKDIAVTEQGEMYLEESRKLLYEDTQPIDVEAMADFIAVDVEYEDGRCVKGNKHNKWARQSILLDYGSDGEEYGDVDVCALFDCPALKSHCPLQMFLQRRECHAVKGGWFFQYDMRSLRYDAGTLKQHIIAHVTARQLQQTRHTIDGKKVSGFFIPVEKYEVVQNK